VAIAVLVLIYTEGLARAVTRRRRRWFCSRDKPYPKATRTTAS
jgi:hypothetical protein